MKFKETEKVELKKSTSELKDGIKSICAILNKHGKGKLIFGINGNGKVVGQQVSEKTLRGVSQQISNSIEPKIFPKVFEKFIEGSSCVVVEFDGKSVPYFAYGRAYIRVADEDRLLSSKELEKLILDKNKNKLRWDSEICEKAMLKDISEEKLITFLNEANLKFSSVLESLENLGLVKKNKFTNACVILFGKNPIKFFMNAKLRCATFIGGNTASKVLDMTDYEGDLFDLIMKAETYILQHINVGMKIEGMKRIDIPEIDKGAFREAIINAFCHRDYNDYDSVSIAIFSDHVEIRNPGGLYGNLTINDIRKKNISKRRNELIADIFHRIHFVEKWGMGIKLILDKEPRTRFEEIADMFVTVFKRNASVNASVNAPVNLLNLQKKIIAELMKDKKITLDVLSVKLAKDRRTITRNILRLKEEGLIERVGSDKGGYWNVK